MPKTLHCIHIEGRVNEYPLLFSMNDSLFNNYRSGAIFHPADWFEDVCTCEGFCKVPGLITSQKYHLTLDFELKRRNSLCVL